jgi:hypothetical protein
MLAQRALTGRNGYQIRGSWLGEEAPWWYVVSCVSGIQATVDTNLFAAVFFTHGLTSHSSSSCQTTAWLNERPSSERLA